MSGNGSRSAQYRNGYANDKMNLANFARNGLGFFHCCKCIEKRRGSSVIFFCEWNRCRDLSCYGGKGGRPN